MFQSLHPRLLAVAMVVCWTPSLQAQQAAATFARGSGQQSWQQAGYAAVAKQCKKTPAPFSIAINPNVTPGEPLAPVLPPVVAINTVVADAAQWRVVWAWQGNNADGPIAADNGTLLFANQDAGNVMQLDPATGLAKILYDHTNTGGALSRSKNGALFLGMRGLGSGVEQLQPQRRLFATSLDGEPLDCAGGVVNDISADSKGGVYLAISGSGVFYADAAGVITRYGKDVAGANGIILSPNEQVLYVTNGRMLVAFDVQANGALTRQRDFAPLSGGGDGSAVDQDGRIYVANGAGVDVIAADGTVLGTIAGPRGLHGVAFGGKDKRTLFGIVFYGGWGTPAARNQIVALPMLSQGYVGRAK